VKDGKCHRGKPGFAANINKEIRNMTNARKDQDSVFATSVALHVALAIVIALVLTGLATRSAQAAPAQTLTYTALYSFTGGADGGYPSAGLVPDAAGNLYGTTSEGGSLSGCSPYGCGLVFKLDPTGNERVLYTFTGGADGGLPYAGLIRDAGGNLYGTTFEGGDLSGCYGSGCGVVFKLDPAGNETVLYTFTGGADGANPAAGLIRDAAGDFYGTTENGGTYQYGAVFKLDPAGNETALYTFTGGIDGASPAASLIRDAAGNLYGTAAGGGNPTGECPYGCGVVFKLDPAGNETVLRSFTGGTDGGFPYAGLILDAAGNLYGTTNQGGTPNGCGGNGCGVVFKLDPAGNETVLHSFTGGAGGAILRASLIRDPAGNLYGTTAYDGAHNYGMLFGLRPNGQETAPHSFTGTDGAYPMATLLSYKRAPYGTTTEGGTSGGGVVFKITLP
jgi:uncharacterized repeat protein (TIGR03803 family)